MCYFQIEFRIITGCFAVAMEDFLVSVKFCLCYSILWRLKLTLFFVREFFFYRAAVNDKRSEDWDSLRLGLSLSWEKERAQTEASVQTQALVRRRV